MITFAHPKCVSGLKICLFNRIVISLVPCHYSVLRQEKKSSFTFSSNPVVILSVIVAVLLQGLQIGQGSNPVKIIEVKALEGSER